MPHQPVPRDPGPRHPGPQDPGPQETAAEFAVLIPLLKHAGERCVLLTKRPDSLKRYSGQVSLPGGARDPEDRDLLATALRETHEEVGIAPERVHVLRELDWHSTSLGHRVKPFLARVDPGPITPDPGEVERILYLPVAFLERDPFQVRGAWRDQEGRLHTTWTLNHEGLEVWGLTARILKEAFGTAQGDRPEHSGQD